ncbi:reverse transcriptase domain-containing protein [Thiolapillus sp.]|uniref:reverse transcriptase domain-containing protein n=3 Tax=Thiolapillus sp. TaxID=2017437 RepID=UPI003AF910A6
MALFVYIFTNDLPLVFKQTAAGDMSQVHRKGLLTTITDILSYTLVTSQKLLLRSGDVEANPGPISVKPDLCVIHLNARSIKNKIDLLEAEADQFDIITVSETWLSQTDANSSIHLTNYHPPIRRDRPNDPHGGVAIYVKNNLFCKPRPDLQVNDLEAVWVETKINQESLLIGSFYRSPNSRANYWELINDSIRKANNTVLKFIILGDFNTDVFNNPSQHLTDILNQHQLYQLINSPTRITETTSSCLDLIITQSPQLVTRTEVLPAICSDHSVPCAYVRNTVIKNKPFKRIIYNYSKLNVDKFCNLLRQVNWINIIENNTMDVSAINFTDTFMTIAKQCMPVKTVLVRQNDAQWMNDEIRLLIVKRNKLHKKAKQTNLATDWERFRKVRNYVISRIRLRKIDYLKELDNKASDPNIFGQKDWWRLVKTFLNKKGIDTDVIPPLAHNGNTYYSNKEKANILNDFFISQSTLEHEDDTPPDLPRLDCQINDITLSVSEVSNAIQNLDKGKATGPDQVHNRLLIASAAIIIEPLSKLFNRSLRENKFPAIWKVAHVTPLHKKGPKELCNNYRPISLLSCVGKLLERCVHKRVYNYLQYNNIITQSQSGFIPGDSTVNQLLCIYNDLCTSFDRGITTQAVYLDISKAFDRVWHKGLLSKLEAVGIRGNLLNWFCDYLSSRMQATVIKGDKSDLKEVPAGVPQGSVLGPLLFLIYINDIVNNIRSVIKLFADDTSLSLALNNPDLRAEILNYDLEKISTWAKKWKVKFNQEKTELLNFTRGIQPNQQLVFDSTLLNNTTHHKHLGVVLQNNCRWDEHIRSISNKTNMLISCLRSYKYKISRMALETMYKSFIMPHFDYADIIWDNCTETQSNMLENLHLEAIRIIIGGVRGTSHQKLYEESGFCTLKERRRRHKLLMFKKMQLGLCPQYIIDLLPPLVSARNPYHRRRPLEREVPSCKTELLRKSFILSTTTDWNSLPVSVQQTTSLSVFKRLLCSSDNNVPAYYYIGDRIAQINHCRLRLQMSNLNNDLFTRHLRIDPKCPCGHPQETAEHYLLHCTRYHTIRATTIFTLPTDQIDIRTLLHGDPNLQNRENEHIFLSVHDFINQSKRL